MIGEFSIRLTEENKRGVETKQVVDIWVLAVCRWFCALTPRNLTQDYPLKPVRKRTPKQRGGGEFGLGNVLIGVRCETPEAVQPFSRPPVCFVWRTTHETSVRVAIRRI